MKHVKLYEDFKNTERGKKISQDVGLTQSIEKNNKDQSREEIEKIYFKALIDLYGSGKSVEKWLDKNSSKLSYKINNEKEARSEIRKINK